MTFEFGTVAEWVSGIGSIAASIVALYLAGSERRSRKLAERPHITCKVERIDDGWATILLQFTNPSPKLWQLVGITARDRHAAVIPHDDTMVDKEDSYEPEVCVDRRAALAKRQADVSRDIRPHGALRGSWEPSGPGNTAYIRLFYQIPAASRTIRFDLNFRSCEPIPETFLETVSRPVN